MKQATLILCTLILSSCIVLNDNAKYAKGDIESAIYTIDKEYHGLAISSCADVIVDDTLLPTEVRVKTHSDIFEALKIEVKDDALHIGLNIHDIIAKTFEVRVPELNYAEIGISGGSSIEWHNCDIDSLNLLASGGADADISGKCNNLTINAAGGTDIEFDNLCAKRIELLVSGGADVTIKGACHTLTVSASAGADAELGELIAENASVDASGGADVIINATKSLNANASGGADIEYIGTPTSLVINSSRGADIKHIPTNKRN